MTGPSTERRATMPGKPRSILLAALCIHPSDEPGSVNEDGTPSETALCDFVVLINPAVSEQDTFRSAVETFDQPEG